MKIYKQRGYFTKIMETNNDYLVEIKETNIAMKDEQSRLAKDKNHKDFLKRISLGTLEAHMQFWLGERSVYTGIKMNLWAFKKGEAIQVDNIEPYSYLKGIGYAQAHINSIIEELEKRGYDSLGRKTKIQGSKEV